jgi:hypothetical protein
MKAARFGNEDSIHRVFERTPLGAMVQSGTVLSETAKHLFEEWADIGEHALSGVLVALKHFCNAARRRTSLHYRASCCAITWKLLSVNGHV